MDPVCIVTARRGSRDIPRKNLRQIAGMSLISWALAPAVMSGFRVIVTTDDPEVKRIALSWKVEVVDRPAELATDDTPDYPVFDHLLKTADIPKDAILVHLRPTAPFRRAEEIREVAEGIRGATDTVRSVRPIRLPHPCKAYLETAPIFGHRRLVPATNHHRPNHPRQGLPTAWAAAGFIDAVTAEVVRSYRRMEGSCIRAWPVPEDRAVDLDTEEDFARAAQLALARGWTPGRLR